MICCAQALKLRQQAGEITAAMIGPGIQALMDAAPLIEEDRPLDKTLIELTAQIARRDWQYAWPGDAERAE